MSNQLPFIILHDHKCLYFDDSECQINYHLYSFMKLSVFILTTFSQKYFIIIIISVFKYLFLI